MTELVNESQGDLPELLDTLTAAVTALDAVGVDGYKELYLHVIGTTAERSVRDLRVEKGRLIVGPPTDDVVIDTYLDHEFGATRSALVLAELISIMRIWRWSLSTMASYLHCSQGALSAWLGRPAWLGVSPLPYSVMQKTMALSILDRARSLSGVTDQAMPNWLSSCRPIFGRRSIEEVLRSDDNADFVQLVMWTLNSSQTVSAVH